MVNMKNNNIDKLTLLNSLMTVMLTVLVMLSLLWVLLPSIWDTDLWWHLKTGSYILKKGQLFSEDIFAFTSEKFSTPRESAILKGYPASQILYALLYEISGFTGIFVLRIVLVFSIFLALVRFSVKRGADVQSICIVSVMSWGVAQWAHTFDRPTVFSFFFFTILISSLRPVGNERWWVVPMMSVWANFHGGYIVGDIALVVYLLGRFFDVGLNVEFKKSILWVFLCVLASFVNPNGAYFFLSIFYDNLAGASTGYILEYKSTLFYFSQGANIVLLSWSGFFLALIARIGNRRFVWSEVFLLGFFGCLAIIYVRMTAFFFLGFLPLIASDLSRLLQKKNEIFRLSVVFLLLIALAFPVFFSGQRVLANDFGYPEDNPFYPVSAATFLQKTNLKGNMFNSYDWGGYLIWKLYPQYQVFIDGRVLDEELYEDYRTIGSARTTRNVKLYQSLLDQYKIEFSLLQFQKGTGDLIPLFTRLYRDPSWGAVYVDETAVIFVRENSTNMEILEKYRVSKPLFDEKMEANFQRRIDTDLNDIKAWIGLTHFYFAADKIPEARSTLKSGLNLFPENSKLQWLKPYILGVQKH